MSLKHVCWVSVNYGTMSWPAVNSTPKMFVFECVITCAWISRMEQQAHLPVCYLFFIGYLVVLSIIVEVLVYIHLLNMHGLPNKHSTTAPQVDSTVVPCRQERTFPLACADRTWSMNEKLCSGWTHKQSQGWWLTCYAYKLTSQIQYVRGMYVHCMYVYVCVCVCMMYTLYTK